MTLKMTLNHQNIIRNQFFSQNKHILQSKSHQKEVLHLFILIFMKKKSKFDIQIDLLTLKMTLNHQNNTTKVFSSQNHIIMTCYTCSYLYELKIIFLQF